MDTPESLVYIAEGSFGLLDAGEIPAHTADWSNGFVATMQCGALIATGTHTGYVRVQAISQHYRPDLSPADARWDEIVEVTVRAPHGKLSVESLEQGPATGLPVLSSSGAGSTGCGSTPRAVQTPSTNRTRSPSRHISCRCGRRKVANRQRSFAAVSRSSGV